MKTPYRYVWKTGVLYAPLFFLLSFLSSNGYAQEVKVTIQVKRFWIGQVDTRGCWADGSHCNDQAGAWAIQAKTNLDAAFPGAIYYPDYGGWVDFGPSGGYTGDISNDQRWFPLSKNYSSMPSTVDINLFGHEEKTATGSSISVSYPLDFPPNQTKQYNIYYQDARFYAEVLVSYTIVNRSTILSPYRIANYCADETIKNVITSTPSYPNLPAGLVYKWEYAFISDANIIYHCKWVKNNRNCVDQKDSEGSTITYPCDISQCSDCEAIDIIDQPGSCYTLQKTFSRYDYKWRPIGSANDINSLSFTPTSFGINPTGNSYSNVLFRLSIVNSYGHEIFVFPNSDVFVIFPASPSVPLPTVSIPEGNTEYITHTDPLCNGGFTGTISIKKTGNFKYTLVYKNGTTPSFPEPGGSGTFTLPGVIKGQRISTTDSTMFVGLKAGNYTILVENLAYDSNGNPQARCYTMSNIITLTDPLALSASAPNVVNQIQCKGGKGTVKIDISGGTPPYYYSIDNKQNWITADVLTSTGIQIGAANYTFDIKDANNCTASTGITLSEPTKVVFGSIKKFSNLFDESYGYQISCANGHDGNIEVHGIKGGTGNNYTIAVFKKQPDGSFAQQGGWNNVTFAIGATDIKYQFRGLYAGIYKVQVKDGNLCLSDLSSEIELIAPDPLAITNISKTDCYDSKTPNSGFISFKATGGVGDSEDTPYVYTISDGVSPALTAYADADGIATFGGLAPGTYTLSAEYLGICSNVTKPSITIYEPLGSQEVQNIGPSCLGSSDGLLEATGTGGSNTGYSYLWTNSQGDVLGTSSLLTGIPKGNYTLQVSDNGVPGCSSTFNFTVNDPPQLDVKIGGIPMENRTICVGSTLPLSPTLVNPGTGQTFTYSWTSDKGSTWSGPTIPIQQKGWYRLQVLSDKGCAAEDTIFIKEEYLDPGIPDSYELCRGQRQILAPKASGVSYTWKDGNGNVLGTGSTYEALDEGTYYLKLVQSSGCTGYDTVKITYGDYLPLDLPPSQTVCVGQRVTLDAGYDDATYTWKDASGNLLGTARTYTALKEGIYSLKVVLGNGCTGFGTSQVKYGNYLNIPLQPEQTVCVGQRVTLDAGYDDATYTWKDASGNLLGTGRTYTALQEGIYHLDVVLNTGCMGSTTTQVKYGSYLNIPIQPVQTVCVGQRVTLDAGYGDATYTWKDASGSLLGSGRTYTALNEGTYYLKVVLGTGCIGYDTIKVVYGNYLPKNLRATSYLCKGEKITLDAGYDDATYTWKDGKGNVLGNSRQLDVTVGGKYYLKVVKSSGCIGYDSTAVEYHDLSLHVAPDVNILCKGQSLDIDAGDLGYQNSTYRWTSPNGFSSSRQNVSLKDDGTYYLAMVLTSGCQAYDTLQVITKQETLKAEFLVSNVPVVGDTLVAIDLTYPVPMKVSWEVIYGGVSQTVQNNGQTYLDHPITKEGWYTIRMTAYNYGCTDVKEKKVYAQDIGIKPDPSSAAGGGNAAGGINDWVREFSLYPNPNQGDFKCKVVLDQAMPVDLMLYSTGARQYMDHKTSPAAKEHHIDFSESQLAKGMYFLILEINGERKSLRFVVY